MSGHGSLLELATLKEYLPDRAPRTVLWFFYPGNDLYELDLELRDALLVRYLEEGFRQNLMKGVLTQLIDGESPSFSRFIEFFSLRPLRRFATPTSPPRRDFSLFRRVMDEASRTVGSWGGRLIFVYLPDHVIVPRLPASAREDRARTLETVRSLQIPVVDVEAATRSTSRSDLFYYSTSHYSEQGNRIVAEITLQALSAF